MDETTEFISAIGTVVKAAIQDALYEAAHDLQAQAEATDYWTLAEALNLAAGQLARQSDDYRTDDDTLIFAERYLTEYANTHVTFPDGYADN